MTQPPATPLRFTDRLVVLLPVAMLTLIAAGITFELQTFAFFLINMGTVAIGTLLFLIWWFTRRSFSWGNRLLVFAAMLVIAVGIGALTHGRVDPPVFLFLWGAPAWLTVWWIWYASTRHLPQRSRALGLIAALAVVWSPFLLIRTHGLRGNMLADLHWRWTPSAEESFLAQLPQKHSPAATQSTRTLTLKPGDFPAFRGENRDGVAHPGVTLSLDWANHPPKILWKQRVGPAWSSAAIVDSIVFTQEQRGQREAVVARDLPTGDELWSHEDPQRFDEGMSGPGPRATPTFADGRLYTFGATGTLLCLDPATGQQIWSADARNDSGAALPVFGFSSSPLVMGDRVIVFAGGENHKGLLAYGVADGKLLWTADAGEVSYASPQAHHNLALIFTDEALFAVHPANGQLAWQYAVDKRVGLPASLQACPIPGSDDLILQNGAAFGAQRIHLSGDAAPPTRVWVTKSIKPSFSDMVYHAGHLYGFDSGPVFCCVNADTGQRTWRTGHYGAGQALLLPDQGAMIITTEDGQVVLLRCNPEKSEELGRTEAISGKAWNHPALAGNHLIVRSDAEMACIELP